MFKKIIICLNYGHFEEEKIEVSDRILKSLSQQNL